MGVEENFQWKEEIARVRTQVEEIMRDRHDDRVRRAEDYGAFRVQVTAMEARLAVVEEGVRTLMMHSTWLLRILVGGIAIALVQFALTGGLTLARGAANAG